MKNREKRLFSHRKDAPRMAVAVDVAVFTLVEGELRVLLIQRGIAPFEGSWALPGGFVEEDEDLEAAAARELHEETGIRPAEAHLEQLRCFGRPDRDPDMRVLSVAFWALVPNLREPRGGSDARYAEILPVREFESGRLQLAFDHAEILAAALEAVRSALERRPIATSLCASEFTVSQLREVYESVWDTELDPGNFHRKVSQVEGFVVPLDRKEDSTERGGRPAKLYRAGEAEHLDPPLRRRRR